MLDQTTIDERKKKVATNRKMVLLVFVDDKPN